MTNTRSINKQKRLRLNRLFMVFMAFLLSFSGILPSISPAKAQVAELKGPDVSKDVEGERSKEVTKGQEYNYHVKVTLPEDISSYETMTISDDLEERLIIQGASATINGEENDTLIVVVEGQTVSLALEHEQLQELAGKEIKLQITTQVQEDAAVGEEIENIAQVVINDNVVMKTNPAVVIPVETEDSNDNPLDMKSTEASINEVRASAGDVFASQVPAYSFNGENEITVFNKIGFYHLQAIGGSNVWGYDVSNDPAIKGRYIDADNDPSTFSSSSMEFIPNGELVSAFLYISPDNIKSSTDSQPTFIEGPKGGRLLFDLSIEGVYDITDFVNQEGAGHYWGKNLWLQNPLSIPWGNDALANWDIVFVEKNESLPPMMTKLNYYNGIHTGTHPDFTATLSDQPFLTKQDGNLMGSMVASVYGGNQNIDNDQYRIIAYKDNQVLHDSYMSDSARDENNFWNGSITRNGQNISARNPDRTPANTDIFNYDFTSSPYFPAGIDRIDQMFTAKPVNDMGSVDGYEPHFWGVALEVIPPELEINKYVGNKEQDKTNYEVGDTVVYSIVAKKTVDGTIAKSVTIEDELPDGLEFVEGTLEATHNAVPEYNNGKITVNFGDVSDTDERTVTLEAKILDNQAGNTINNIATVKSDGLDPIYAETEITVDSEVPTDPSNVCTEPVALINGSFEEPIVIGSEYIKNAGSGAYYALFPEDKVPGWKTTASDKLIEVWDESFLKHPNKPLVDRVPDGKQVAELNATEVGALYQDVKTTPGQTIYWRLYHQGKYGTDTMDIRIGSADVHPNQLQVVASLETGPTEWKQYSGTYKVPAGQVMTRFAFNSTTETPFDGNILDDIFLGTDPCVTAEKSVSPKGDIFEGDELTYEVTVKNAGGDVAANTIIEDAIPEGTKYVPGSMKIVNGPIPEELTDADDADAGHFDGAKVTFNIGDLPNTNDLPDGITVQFRVKALSSHVGETVVNKAQVKYKNLLKDADEDIWSNEVTNNIVERPDPPNACAAPVALINGSFEEPDLSNLPNNAIRQNGGFWMTVYDDFVPGWQTTDSTRTIEFGSPTKLAPAPVDNKYHYVSDVPNGEQYVELNAYEFGQLYQDVETTPGQTISWRLSHRAALNAMTHGYDKMAVRIGSNTTSPGDLPVVETISTHTSEGWVEYRGTYTVPNGQAITRFGFEAVESVLGHSNSGNFLDDIFLGTEACVTAEKTVSPEGNALVGDELTYEVTVKNGGGDLASNTVIEDVIPEGTEYVPGSMKILTGPKQGDLTDEKDNDAGHYADGKVIFNVGDLPNTNDLPDGITVQFKVKALSDHAGKDVLNKAQVKFKDLLINEDKETETNETRTPIKYKEPVLESEKSAKLETKAEGNTDEKNPEVGDTIRYTITTKNTIEDSMVENLVIADTIPEGLTYVAGSLKVDGKEVTDVNDDDAGHVVDGKVTGTFGNVTDTEEHTVTFLVTVGAGQAGVDIKNIAVITGDNIDNPDEPEEVIEVYPRKSVLESEKFAANAVEGKEKYEVGDTIVYTIRTRNKVYESRITNLSITDVLPAGLSFVVGSLEFSHGGTGEFNDSTGTIRATFGDVNDTEWRSVTFKATIEPGQAGKEIENIATVTGDNVDEPDQPEEKVIVDPKDPKLESKKTATIHEKAEGNTDTDHPEVGDTLLYTISTKNTVTDSLVKNLVITDKIPEGLEYVTGSLEVDGVSVTDEEDSDHGHYTGDTIVGQFGDITDTNEYTLTFLVKVGAGQAGKDIKNIATVGGDNMEVPDQPEEEVKVYPRDPLLESRKSAENLEQGKAKFEVDDTIVYTIQTRNTVTESLVTDLTITDTLPEGLEYVTGSLVIDGVSVTDAEGDDKGYYKEGQVVGHFGDITDTEWHTLVFHAKVLSGQSGKTIKNKATVVVKEIENPDEPEEEIVVDPKDPKLESKKTATIHEKAEGNTDTDHPEVGDTLLYTISTKNTVADSLVKNLVISDKIPEGLEYVNGSLKVDGVSVTDEEDSDTGHYKDGALVGQIGDITDTNEHTLTFLVKVGEGQAGKDIKNIATVGGENMEEPDKPEEEVKVYPRDPILESEKSAANFVTDKENYEVGDTIVYTIRTRNTITESWIINLEIADKLPAGLAYVEGSLEVSHSGTGAFKDGTIAANFGDVNDTEWRSVTFMATIEAGQAGKEIENIAIVEGDNVDEPDQPEEKVIVDPKDPVTPPTDPGDGTPPTEPGDGTPPTNPGDGMPPTNPGDGTPPTDPGDGMPPTNPGDGTPPTDPGDGTPPTDPGDGTPPTEPGDGTPPTEPGGGTPPTDPGDGTPPTEPGTPPTNSGDGTVITEEEGGTQLSKGLPNTATHIYNLELVGVITLLVGWLFIRRKTRKQQ